MIKLITLFKCLKESSSIFSKRFLQTSLEPRSRPKIFINGVSTATRVSDADVEVYLHTVLALDEASAFVASSYVDL